MVLCCMRLKKRKTWTAFCLLMLATNCGTINDPVEPRLQPIVSSNEGPENGTYVDMLAGQPESDRPKIDALIDQFTAEALEGVDLKSPSRTIVLHLAWWVHAHLWSDNPSPTFTVLRALEQRMAKCGGTSIIFQLMVRKLGLPTRTVGLFNVPIQGGHTIAEVKWGGQWHFIDPTFGVFLTQDGTFEGEIISFETILKYQHLIAKNAYYAASKGRLGVDYLEPRPTTLGDMYSKLQVAMISSGNYELFLAGADAAAVYVSGRTLRTWQVFDLTGVSEITIGTADDSGDDIVAYQKTPKYYEAIDLKFLGDISGTYGHLVNEHTYYIRGLTPGTRFTWRAGLTEGNAHAIQLSARKGIYRSSDRSERFIEGVFEALRDEMEIHLVADTKTRASFDYHRITRD